MPDLKELKQYLDRSAEAYKAFRKRMAENPLLTREEKNNRVRTYLDSHVSVFDAYYSARRQVRRYPNGNELPSYEADSMARDIASLFTDDSVTGQWFLDHTELRGEAGMRQYLARRRDEEVLPPEKQRQDRIEDEVQIETEDDDEDFGEFTVVKPLPEMPDSPSSYMTAGKQNFRASERRTSGDYKGGPVEDPQAAADSAAVPAPAAAPAQDPKEGLTDAQIKGIRDISAFLYRNTMHGVVGLRTNYSAFVEGITARSRREKLLIYYTVEKGHTHSALSPNEIDQILAPDGYEPNLSLFKDQIFKGPFKGLFHRISGDYLDWDKLCDAAINVSAVLNAMKLLGPEPVRAPERPPAPDEGDAPAAAVPSSSGADASAPAVSAAVAEEKSSARSSAAVLQDPAGGGPKPAQDVPETLEMIYIQKLEDAGAKVGQGSWLIGYADPKQALVSLFQGRSEGPEKGAKTVRITNQTLYRIRDLLAGSLSRYGLADSGTTTTTVATINIDARLADYMLYLLKRQAGMPISSGGKAESRDPDLSEMNADDAEGGDDSVPEEIVAGLGKVREAGRVIMSRADPSQDEVRRFQQAIDELYGYIDSQSTNKWTETKEGAATWNARFGYLKGSLKQVSSFLKASLEETSETNDSYKDLKTSGAIFSWGSAGLGTVTTIISLINLVTTAHDIVKGGKGAKELAKLWAKAFKQLTSSFSGGWGLATAIGKETKDALLTGPTGLVVGGAAGLLIGGMSLVEGLHDFSKALDDSVNLQSYEKELESTDVSKLSEDRRREFEAKRELLRNVTASQKAAAERREATATMNTVSAGLQIIGGIAMLGGVTSFVTAGLSAVTFVLGISTKIMEYCRKKAEKKDVIDRYINMPALYQNFFNEHQGSRDPDEFIKRYGKEEDIKDMLRTEIEGYLGFPSDAKLHAYIMERYAQALYQGAFVKSGGEVIKKSDLENEEDTTLAAERQLFVGQIEALGFEVHYPRSSHGKPSPGANEIYKKLMQ